MTSLRGFVVGGEFEFALFGIGTVTGEAFVGENGENFAGEIRWRRDLRRKQTRAGDEPAEIDERACVQLNPVRVPWLLPKRSYSMPIF